MKRTIIGLSGYAKSGKTTAADLLIRHHGFTRIKFAGALKDMLRVFGLDDRYLEGELKDVPCDFLGGKTPRHAMQTLGTEWGRQLLCDDIWIRVWKYKVSQLKSWQPIVTDDVRFENEAQAIRDVGGIVIRLKREGSGLDRRHASEALPFSPDVTIDNDASPTWLLNDICDYAGLRSPVEFAQ